jgi:hypothetical protein
MSGSCTFNVGEVRRLYEHSKASSSHRASFSQSLEKQYMKDGKIDHSLIPSSLELVGDNGIYLMSSGIPSLPIDKKESNVVYCKESNPHSGNDDWYDAKRDIFGGDDGVEHLPLAMFDKVMLLPDTATFKIKITPTNINVIVPAHRAKPVNIPVGLKIKFNKPLSFDSGSEASEFLMFKMLSKTEAAFETLDCNKDQFKCRMSLKKVKDFIRNETATII